VPIRKKINLEESFLTAALRVAGVIAAAVALWPTETARAEYPVSIELVLAIDISRSVDDVEYDLQKTGIAQAFRNPEIIDLIRQNNGVAVTLFQWDEAVDGQHMIPWHLLSDPASVLSFATKVEALERDPIRKFTGIGRAIEFGVHLITQNDFAGRRLKIDISGDGRDNIDSLTPASRQLAQSLGIEINGLPILIDTFNLDIYYREQVISGPGAFLEIATDYDDFARAFLRKLWREIVPSISRNDPTPGEPDLYALGGERHPLRIACADRTTRTRSSGKTPSCVNQDLCAGISHIPRMSQSCRDWYPSL
jgi:hypothetical protein